MRVLPGACAGIYCVSPRNNCGSSEDAVLPMTYDIMVFSSSQLWLNKVTFCLKSFFGDAAYIAEGQKVFVDDEMGDGGPEIKYF